MTAHIKKEEIDKFEEDSFQISPSSSFLCGDRVGDNNKVSIKTESLSEEFEIKDETVTTPQTSFGDKSNSKDKSRDKTEWFSCDQCPYKGRVFRRLKSHIIHKHLPEDEIEWYECEQCDFRAKSVGGLKKHTRNNHMADNKIKWFHCDHCPYKAKMKNHLNRHVLRKHVNDDQIKWQRCEYCDFKTKTPEDLTSHINYRHVTEDMDSGHFFNFGK